MRHEDACTPESPKVTGVVAAPTWTVYLSGANAAEAPWLGSSSRQPDLSGPPPLADPTRIGSAPRRVPYGVDNFGCCSD